MALNTFDDRNQKVKDYSFTYTYSTRINDVQATNIDLNALLYDVCPGYMPIYGTDVAQVLTAIGRTGRRCANLTATNMLTEEFTVESNDQHTITESEIIDTQISWEMHPDGGVKKTECLETYQRIRKYPEEPAKNENLFRHTLKNSYEIYYE